MKLLSPFQVQSPKIKKTNLGLLRKFDNNSLLLFYSVTYRKLAQGTDVQPIGLLAGK